MTRPKRCLCVFAGVLALLGATSRLPALHARGQALWGPDAAVHALFEVDRRETAPFPSDIFTVPDPADRAPAEPDSSRLFRARFRLPRPGGHQHPRWIRSAASIVHSLRRRDRS